MGIFDFFRRAPASVDPPFAEGTRVRYAHKGLGTVTGARANDGESYIAVELDGGGGMMVPFAEASRLLERPPDAAEAEALMARTATPLSTPPRSPAELTAALRSLGETGLPLEEAAELAREVLAADLDAPPIRVLRFMLMRALFEVLAEPLGVEATALEARAIAARAR